MKTATQMEKVVKYIGEHQGTFEKLDSKEGIKKIASHFGISPETAKHYYYDWRIKYLHMRSPLTAKRRKVELKNIDLTGITETEEYAKLAEEHGEFMTALEKKDKENAIEEFWDVVQVYLGILDIELGIPAGEVTLGYSKHLEKIKNRPRVKEIKG